MPGNRWRTCSKRRERAPLSWRSQSQVLVTLVLGALVASPVSLDVLGELVSIGTLFAFIVACAAVLYLRRAQPDLPRPFCCPGLPWVPVAGVLACLYLILGFHSKIPGAGRAVARSPRHGGACS